MTVDRVSTPDAARQASAGDVFLDGLFTGMIGALAVALWFLALDVAAGHPLYTPALLGSVLLHGGSAASTGLPVAPLEVAAYTAFHFTIFVVVGVLFSYLMTLFERFPIVGFVLLMLLLCLQLGFYVLNAALGQVLLGALPLWSVIVANLLAAVGMVAFQWKRHPSVMKGVEKLWEET